jgi:hypothetical protein
MNQAESDDIQSCLTTWYRFCRDGAPIHGLPNVRQLTYNSCPSHRNTRGTFASFPQTPLKLLALAHTIFPRAVSNRPAFRSERRLAEICGTFQMNQAVLVPVLTNSPERAGRFRLVLQSAWNPNDSTLYRRIFQVRPIIPNFSSGAKRAPPLHSPTNRDA